jgi:DNA-binding beta-propeller fold protein YncE
MNFIAKPKVPTHEIRMNVLNATNNKINVNNEGVKHGGYERVLARRKADNLFSVKCKSLRGNCIKQILGIQQPIAICVYNDYLYIASFYLNTTISRYNLVTHAFDAQWVQFPDNFIAFDLVAQGNYLYTGIQDEIIRINITTGVSETWIPDTEGLGQIFGLTIYNNHLYIINFVSAGSSQISKINLTTGVSSLILDWYTPNEIMVSMREYNNMLYIVNFEINTITRYDLLTNAVIEDWIPASAGLLLPISLTIYNGIMYVSNYFSISKININSKQVQNNWVKIPLITDNVAPFLMLTNYTINDITKIYVSSINNNAIYSIFI